MIVPAEKHGTVVWITGLSGAGKSTLATEVVRRRRATSHAVVLLDGDVLRRLFGGELGHSPQDRRVNADRIARTSQFLAWQGIDVVVATMSLFPDLHVWNRSHIPGYFEVYVRVPLEELKRRDARGLYSRAMRGEASNVVGVDLPFEAPMAPDLVLDNDYSAERLEGNTAEVIGRAFPGA